MKKTIQRTPMTWCTYLQSFMKNTAMHFRVTVNVTDGQTDRRPGVFQYFLSRAFGAAGDNKTPRDARAH